MGDQFEKFIFQNRESFDNDSPSEDAWKQIESRLPAESKSDFSWLWKVAAMFFLVLSSALLLDRFNQPKLTENEFNQQFKEAEAFYTSMIEEKKREISSFEKSQLSTEFLKDVEKLDSMYKDLKKTFKTDIADEQVVNAMIKNLQLRIKILNQQLMIIENLNRQQNENDNSTKI